MSSEVNEIRLPEITEILYSEEELHQAVSSLAQRISSDYAGKDLVVVCVLKGSVIFFSDLVRELDINCTLDFISASSYGSSTVSSGVVRIKTDLSTDISGKDVLIVEDILDTGNTLYCLMEYFNAKVPSSVRICTLFDKPSRRAKPINADYSCFTIGDNFIVGYGLDFNEKYRNLSYVGILDPEKCK